MIMMKVPQVIGILIHIIVLLTVWGLFSLPVIFYYRSKEGGSIQYINDLTDFFESLRGICLPKNISFNESCQGDLNITKVSVNESEDYKLPDCVTYGNSGPCTDVLTDIVEFEDLSYDDEIKVQPNCTILGKESCSISEIDSLISQLLDSPIVSSECKEDGLPFLCQYFFPPCVNDTSNIVLPSKQDCIKIETKTCKVEWTILSNLPDYSSSLPDCNCLPKVSQSNKGQYIQTNESVEMVRCASLFTQVDCFCLPSCSTFRVNTESGQIAEDFFIYLAIVTFFLTASAYLILVYKRRKTLLRYPIIIILHINIILSALAIVVLIGKVYPDNGLYCSHSDFLQTILAEPTAYCIISGVTFQFTVTFAFILWLLHIIHIWITLFFPIWSRRLTKHLNLIHVSVMVITALICSIGPIVVLAKYKYVLTRLPPLVCVANDLDVVFYSIILPINIIVPLGVSFLANIFWIAWKSQSFKKNRSFTPEAKILTLSIFYILAGVFLLVRFSESSGGRNNYINKILSFSRCYFEGNDKECPDIESIVNKTSVALNITSFFLIGLIPLANLGFGIKISDLQRLYKCFMKSQPVHMTSKSALPNNSFKKKTQNASTLKGVENSTSM